MSFDEEPAVVLLCVPDDAVAFDGAGAGSLALTNLSRASCVCFRTVTSTPLGLLPRCSFPMDTATLAALATTT